MARPSGRSGLSLLPMALRHRRVLSFPAVSYPNNGAKNASASTDTDGAAVVGIPMPGVLRLGFFSDGEVATDRKDKSA